MIKNKEKYKDEIIEILVESNNAIAFGDTVTHIYYIYECKTCKKIKKVKVI